MFAVDKRVVIDNGCRVVVIEEDREKEVGTLIEEETRVSPLTQRSWACCSLSVVDGPQLSH